MQNVILAAHILACIIMTIVIMLQKSEGGALGIGGGGGGGGLMTGRSVAGALVRVTMIFGGLFFLTSLSLTTLANRGLDERSAVERTLEETGGEAPGLLGIDAIDNSLEDAAERPEGVSDDVIAPPSTLDPDQIAPPLPDTSEETVDNPPN